MKLRIGIACIVAALALAVVAIVSMDWAPLAAMLGLALAFLGIGLVAEATDPRRKPNPRTHDVPIRLILDGRVIAEAVRKRG